MGTSSTGISEPYSTLGSSRSWPQNSTRRMSERATTRVSGVLGRSDERFVPGQADALFRGSQAHGIGVAFGSAGIRRG